MRRKLLLLLVALLPMVASAYDAEIDGIYYNFSWDEAEVTYQSKSFNSYSGSVIIPESVTYNGNTYRVTSIGNKAFYSCQELSSITIPKSVISIVGSPFYGCTNLTSVYITDLASWCIIDFEPYVGSNPLQYAQHFYLNGEEIENLVIPEGVTSIGNRAFENCRSLTSVTIPNTVMTIGSTAFADCHALTSITIPASVMSIGYRAFFNCYFTQDSFINNSQLTDNSYWGATLCDEESDGVLIRNDSVIKCRYGTISAIIPNGVTSIGNYAFQNCTNLTSVTIPESVMSIELSAFQYCTSLTSVTIEDGMKSIASSAFKGCCDLTSIILPNSIAEIGNNVFEDCSALTNVTLGRGLKSIGTGVFKNCSNLKYLTILGNVIPSFSNCPKNFVELTFGGSVIPYYAFAESASLEKVTLLDGVIRIGSSAFYACNKLSTVILPATLRAIEGGAFASCGLTSFTIPANVMEVGNGFIDNCSSLKKLVIEEGEDTLRVNGAIGSNYLTNLYINRNIVNLYPDGKTFSNCEKLASIIIGNKVSSFYTDDFIYCTNVKSIIFEDGEDEISILNHDNSTTYNYLWQCPIQTLNIGRNIKEGSSALNITHSFSAKISDTVTYFDKIFQGCSGLTSITIPNSVTTIGNGAFSGCSGLTRITIPNSVTTIGNTAFARCSGLTRITIPNSVVNIGSGAFVHCSKLQSVSLPDGLTKLEANMFDECANLRTISIPESVTELGEFVFNGCSLLQSVVIPDGVPEIGIRAFYECSRLKTITIPGSVKIIRSWAFGNCTKLESLILENGPETLVFDSQKEYSTFENCPIKNVYLDRINTSWSKGLPFIKVNTNFSLTIGQNIPTISDNTLMLFREKMNSITIPNTVTAISSLALNQSYSLAEIILEDGPELLDFGEGNNFYGCPLKSVYLGRDMTYSTNSPFNRNKEGITSLTIGNSVTEIPDGTFLGLKNLTELTLTTGLKKIGGMAFYGCESLTSLSIPSSVTEIGQQAFDLCRNLKTLTLEDSSETLSFKSPNNSVNNAFANSPLKDIYIGRNFDFSNISPFLAIDSLQTLTLSNDVTFLKSRAFASCCGLKEVYSYAEDTPNITSDTFGGIEVSKVLLVVPDDAHEKYKAHPIWKQFWIETPTNNFSSFADKEKLTDIYNFSGQRLPNPQRGINIINGQKVLIK